MPLIGYGLIVGLNKTGDRRQTIFSTQSLANMLQQFGVAVDPAAVKVENIAAVLVTAEPAGLRAARRASSTSRPRRSATRAACRAARCSPRRCAVRPAPSTRSPRDRCRSAASAAAPAATRCRSTTSPSAACRPARWCRRPVASVCPRPTSSPWRCTSPTSSTPRASPRRSTPSSAPIARSGRRSGHRRRAGSRATIASALPELMARLEMLPVTSDAPARVVINERSGTVVVGGQRAHRRGGRRPRQPVGADQHAVRGVAARAAVARAAKPSSCPTRRWTCARARTRGWWRSKKGTTLDAVVRALNALGATPRDIIAIMQALKAAGALRAEIVIL